MFNEQMPKNDTKGAFASLRQADESFKNVKSHIINNEPLAEYFEFLYPDFKKVLDKGDFKEIAVYMRDAFAEFKKKLNCAKSSN